MSKKLTLLAAIVFLGCSNENSSNSMEFPLSSSSSESSPNSESSSSRLSNAELLINGNFELNISDNQTWVYMGWMPNYSIATHSKFEGRNNSGAAKIISIGNANDVGWVQKVNLERNTPYVISGWVKGENITANKIGANISYFGEWNRSFGNSGISKSLSGTFDWTKLSITTLSDSTGETSIACRLGYYNNTVNGTLWCDDFTIQKADMSKIEKGNIVVFVENEDLKNVTIQDIETWVNNLSRAYNFLTELVGAKPYNGHPISVLSREEVSPFGFNGNPISVSRSSIAEFLPRLSVGDWGFGFLHELSHDFEFSGKWNFDGEHWANFKLEYIVESLNATVYLNGKYYTGLELESYWKERHASQMQQYKSYGTFIDFNDCITYTFVKIKDSIGWDPFKKTFASFNALDDSWTSKSNQAKFEKFLTLLSDHSGVDVKSLIPNDEYSAYIAYLNR